MLRAQYIEIMRMHAFTRQQQHHGGAAHAMSLVRRVKHAMARCARLSRYVPDAAYARRRLRRALLRVCLPRLILRCYVTSVADATASCWSLFSVCPPRDYAMTLTPPRAVFPTLAASLPLRHFTPPFSLFVVIACYAALLRFDIC